MEQGIAMSLTPDEIALAWKWRGYPYRESWRNIAETLGVSDKTVMCALFPERAIARNEMRKRKRRVVAAKKLARPKSMPMETPFTAYAMGCDHRITVPREVLADREARILAAPRSWTAYLQGDPLPGRSALEQRGRHD